MDAGASVVMATSFRLGVVSLGLCLFLSGCMPGVVLRCEVLAGDCDFVDKNSYVYLRPQNFDESAVFIARGESKDLTVSLTGSSPSPDDRFDLEFAASDYRGVSVEGISATPSFSSLRAGGSETLWINVSPEVKPGIYQGKVFALKRSIYAVLDVSIAVPN
jgi:hypothetical protein